MLLSLVIDRLGVAGWTSGWCILLTTAGEGEKVTATKRRRERRSGNKSGEKLEGLFPTQFTLHTPQFHILSVPIFGFKF